MGKSADLDEYETRILEYVAGQAGHGYNIASLGLLLRIPVAKIEHYLDRLRSAGLLETIKSTINGPVFSLTQKGRAYVVEHGII